MSLKPKDIPELSRFEWEDPFLLENQLNEDERLMRDAAIAVTCDLKHHCAVSKMLQESGTRVIENWVLNGEEIQTS